MRISNTFKSHELRRHFQTLSHYVTTFSERPHAWAKNHVFSASESVTYSAAVTKKLSLNALKIVGLSTLSVMFIKLI